MREVWRWGINPEEPAYKRTILLSLLGQEDPICTSESNLIKTSRKITYKVQVYVHRSTRVIPNMEVTELAVWLIRSTLY